MLQRGAAIAAAVAAAVAAAAALGWAVLRFRHDMERSYQRITGRSQLIATRWGDVEWAEGGRGTPVLVVHGSGGGFDQGELIARAVLGVGHRWIAPSRFGYLRSTHPPGATFDDQAHAFAALLDHLGLERVAVVALSHGGPSALLLAALHPQRVSSLTLVSAGVASVPSATQQQANRQGDALTWIFQRDWRYWSATRLFHDRFLAVMGVDGGVVGALTPAQRALADEVIEAMNPVAPRAAGTVFDNRATMPGERIAAITAPTLVLHARDDTLQLFTQAEFAARHIPGARLSAFDRGGHLLMAVEQPAVREAIALHIARNAAAP